MLLDLTSLPRVRGFSVSLFDGLTTDPFGTINSFVGGVFGLGDSVSAPSVAVCLRGFFSIFKGSVEVEKLA